MLNDPGFYLSWVTVVMFSVCCHEAAHAYVAAREGDDTAAVNGFLTLNPLRVMGLYSIVFLALFGIAWGAVPVQPHRFRRRYSHLLVALAGPGTNMLLIAISAVGYAFLSRQLPQEMSFMLEIGIAANAFLLLFNLLPVPMLDGWELYRTIFPALRKVSPEQAQQWGFGILLVILLTGMHTYIWRAAMSLATVLTF